MAEDNVPPLGLELHEMIAFCGFFFNGEPYLRCSNIATLAPDSSVAEGGVVQQYTVWGR